MWSKTKKGAEPTVHGWRQKDFDALIEQISRDNPYLSFAITAVKQSVRIDRDAIGNRIELRGDLLLPRMSVRGTIEVGKEKIGNDSSLGHIAIESLRPTEEEPDGRPNLEFHIKFGSDEEVLEICRTMQAGVQGKRPIGMTMKVAKVSNLEEWASQFAKRAYAPTLHVTQIDFATLVGPSDTEAPPIF